ncbi:hypothetical protein, partial [Bacillus altitudinis]|uniref:hypothetical protein n=1 Tax=Bacillus altitudinis TaxID=293387 RepID=UPI003D0183A5
RMVGIALQSEFAAFFQRTNGVPLEPKREKLSKKSDRLEVEQWRRLEIERAAVAADLSALAEERAALDADRASVQHDRAALSQDAEALAMESAGLVEDRAALDADRVTLAQGVEALAADLAKLDQDRAVLARETKALVSERDALEREKAHVRGLTTRLSGLVKHIEQALKVVVEFAPRVRRVIRDAEASENDRASALAARREIVSAVPPLRRDLGQTRGVLSMLRRQAQPSPPQQLRDPVEESGPGMDGP